MSEWVAVFRESGLRDDVTIANLQDACLRLSSLSQSLCTRTTSGSSSGTCPATTIQPRLPSRQPSPSPSLRQRPTSQSVCRSFSNQTDAGMEILASMHILAPMAGVCAVALRRRTFKPVAHTPTTILLIQQSKASAQEDPCDPHRKDC